MTIEQLRDMLNAQPFRPFRVHLADGRSLQIQHPEFVGHGGGRTFIVYTNADRFEVVDLLLVTSLEVTDGRVKRKKASKRRR